MEYEHEGEENQGGPDRQLEAMRMADRHHTLLQAEFERLRSEQPASPAKVGDRVIVASGLLQRGPVWHREEMHVIGVSDTCVKVRLPSGSLDGSNEVWVSNVLVTDILTY